MLTYYRRPRFGISILRIFWLFIIILPTITLAAVPAPKTDIDETIERIVEARSLTYQYVEIAKEHFKPDSAEYIKAEKLYAAAYSQYSGWNAYVASALNSGHAKHLNNNPTYDAIAMKASNSATAFVTYVNEKTGPQTKVVTTILSSLADLGVKLWTDISKQLDQQRAASAKYFTDATQWQAWPDITNKAGPTDQGTKSQAKPQN